MSLTPLCPLPQRERPEGITADPVQVCMEWMTEKGPFLYSVMPLEEHCWGSAPPGHVSLEVSLCTPTWGWGFVGLWE